MLQQLSGVRAAVPPRRATQTASCAGVRPGAALKTERLRVVANTATATPQRPPPSPAAPAARPAHLARTGGPPRPLALARRVSLAASADAASAQPPSSSPAPQRLAVAAVVAAAAAYAVHVSVPGSLRLLLDALAKSGFTAAFGLIFVSEIGDKTFFIAALLAMRRGRAVVLAGAVAALALMTAISVGLGRLFTRLPDSLQSSLPLGEYAAAALLLFFGVKALKEALAMPPAAPGATAGEEELEEATAVVQKADEASAGGALGDFLQTFALIFVAEWGDRSMLATIALGAAQNPAGVFFGAVAGHALATLLAVLGGSLISKRISERGVAITGGVLFLVFAVATLFGLA